MKYIIDTNFLTLVVRRKEGILKWYEKKNLFQNNTVLSIVSKAEILALSQRRKWGSVKMEILYGILAKLEIVPIQQESIINAYVEIELFSQGVHPRIALNESARNMGKNDLWIAATAMVTNTTLITTDRDFNHLQDYFFEIIYLNPTQF